ncbi:MAG: hypothetical protein LUI14_06375 [Lachnospiraceae bacterium]|nr:hypothetical protein [Lachnospiraceae bacterium]
MLKDYIQNLLSENDRKLDGLEREMQELVNDLSCAEHEVEELQQEKKLDTNIFSPRAMNQHLDEHLEEKQDEIRQLKQRMEYVTQMLEEAMKNRDEFQRLAKEVNEEENEEKNEEKNEEENQIARKTDESDVVPCEPSLMTVEANPESEISDDFNEINSLENEADSDSSETDETAETVETAEIDETSETVETAEIENTSINKDELLLFLNTVYHKTETSLAFLNGNKNRCRTELKNCMKLIREYAQKVENG